MVILGVITSPFISAVSEITAFSPARTVPLSSPWRTRVRTRTSASTWAPLATVSVPGGSVIFPWKRPSMSTSSWASISPLRMIVGPKRVTPGARGLSGLWG